MRKIERTGIGFFTKPKFNITDISKTGNDIIYTKEYTDIKLYIRRDSLFIIELKDNLENRNEEEIFIKKINNHLLYTQYANIIYFLFKNSYDKVIKKENLTLSQLVLYEIVGDESIIVQKDEKTWNINSMSGDAYGKISYNSSCWFPTDKHCVGISQLPKEIFDKIIKDFEKSIDIILDNKDAMQIILLLQKSYITMINEQVDISILMSWTVIERLINIMWEDLLNEKIHSNKRKKTILDIKEYTAGIKTNELLINNKIDNTFANEIDDARKVRNKIMHGNYNMFNKKEKINSIYQIIIPLVLKEINLACKYIELYYNLKIEIETSINSQIY